MSRHMLAMLAVLTASVTAAAAEEPSGPACSSRTDESCACVLAVPPAGEPVAHLSEMNGQVLISGMPGLSAPGNGVAMLMMGDSVVVPDNASARLTAPGCDKKLPAMSSLVIRPQNSCACASLVTTRPVGPDKVVHTAPTSSGGGMIAAAAGGALAIGGVIYLVTQGGGGGESVSP